MFPLKHAQKDMRFAVVSSSSGLACRLCYIVELSLKAEGMTSAQIRAKTSLFLFDWSRVEVCNFCLNFSGHHLILGEGKNTGCVKRVSFTWVSRTLRRLYIISSTDQL